jgi:hypothetical protein
MLSGTVELDGLTWQVTEERRAGPQSQLFTLTLAEAPNSRMHVRPFPGQTVTSLDEVGSLAADPAVRWFCDGDGLQWEARLVVHSEPNSPDVRLVKFISQRLQVHELPYPFADGLGRRSDDELRSLLRELEPTS